MKVPKRVAWAAAVLLIAHGAVLSEPRAGEPAATIGSGVITITISARDTFG